MSSEQTSSAPFRGAIVAMSTDRVIGINGVMPWHYSEDLKRFKARTMGCAVIMGRKTWDAIGHKKLPGRRNIVISRSEVSGVECYNDINKAIAACVDENIWFIGGAKIYRLAMAHISLLDITSIPVTCNREGVTRFPEIDFSVWDAGEKTKLLGKGGLTNVVYKRREKSHG